MADNGVLDSEKRSKLRASYALVSALGEENVGVLLFKNIFILAPEALQLFSFKDEPNVLESRVFKKHCKVVVNALTSVIEELDDANALVRQLRRLGRGHVNLGIVGIHYDVVQAALMKTLGTFVFLFKLQVFLL